MTDGLVRRVVTLQQQQFSGKPLVGQPDPVSLDVSGTSESQPLLSTPASDDGLASTSTSSSASTSAVKNEKLNTEQSQALASWLTRHPRSKTKPISVTNVVGLLQLVLAEQLRLLSENDQKDGEKVRQQLMIWLSDETNIACQLLRQLLDNTAIYGGLDNLADNIDGSLNQDQQSQIENFIKQLTPVLALIPKTDSSVTISAPENNTSPKNNLYLIGGIIRQLYNVRKTNDSNAKTLDDDQIKTAFAIAKNNSIVSESVDGAQKSATINYFRKTLYDIEKNSVAANHLFTERELLGKNPWLRFKQQVEEAKPSTGQSSSEQKPLLVGTTVAKDVPKLSETLGKLTALSADGDSQPSGFARRWAVALGFGIGLAALGFLGIGIGVLFLVAQQLGLSLVLFGAAASLPFIANIALLVGCVAMTITGIVLAAKADQIKLESNLRSNLNGDKVSYYQHYKPAYEGDDGLALEEQRDKNAWRDFYYRNPQLNVKLTSVLSVGTALAVATLLAIVGLHLLGPISLGSLALSVCCLTSPAVIGTMVVAGFVAILFTAISIASGSPPGDPVEPTPEFHFANDYQVVGGSTDLQLDGSQSAGSSSTLTRRRGSDDRSDEGLLVELEPVEPARDAGDGEAIGPRRPKND